MTTRHDVFQNLVDNAMERVIEQGTENASQKDINIALLGWIHTSIHSYQGNENSTPRNGLRGKVQHYGPSGLAGGGFVGLLIVVLERIVG